MILVCSLNLLHKSICTTLLLTCQRVGEQVHRGARLTSPLKCCSGPQARNASSITYPIGLHNYCNSRVALHAMQTAGLRSLNSLLRLLAGQQTTQAPDPDPYALLSQKHILSASNVSAEHNSFKRYTGQLLNLIRHLHAVEQQTVDLPRRLYIQKLFWITG